MALRVRYYIKIITNDMRLKNWIFAGCTILLLASCATPKNITYFPDAQNGETIPLTDVKGIVLKPTDKLSIIVNTKSVELNNILNMPVTSQVIGYQEQQTLTQSRGTSGYTIDPEGNIDFPIIGKVKAAGLTRSELAAHLKQTLQERHTATDAVVTVEYLNLGFSVMGDVDKPGFYKFDNDKVNLLQGLSMASDMKITGKRQNVKVIRTNGNQQEIYIVDLLDHKALMESPAFYLQQNDIIYVEPNSYQKRQSTANASEITKASFWLSAISVLTTVAVLVFK